MPARRPARRSAGPPAGRPTGGARPGTPAPAPPGSATARLVARAVAELFGTVLLVFAGVGTALFASRSPTAADPVGVGHLGVALAFGLAVVAGAFAVGHISGAYFNPAITIGMAFARRLE